MLNEQNQDYSKRTATTRPAHTRAERYGRIPIPNERYGVQIDQAKLDWPRTGELRCRGELNNNNNNYYYYYYHNYHNNNQRVPSNGITWNKTKKETKK